MSVSMGEILDGRVVARRLKEDLRERVAKLAAQGVVPCLVLLRVGDDPASGVYVRGKAKMSKAVGVTSRIVHLPQETTQSELLHEIAGFNQDRAVHGILVQLPLGGHMDEDEVLLAVDPEKDVDGFHPLNMGLLTLGRPRFMPATPRVVNPDLAPRSALRNTCEGTFAPLLLAIHRLSSANKPSNASPSSFVTRSSAHRPLGRWPRTSRSTSPSMSLP